MSEFRKTDVGFDKADPEQKLYRNAVQCLLCGEILESTFRHDFRRCGCDNQTTTDGGLDYHRWGGKDMHQVKNLCEYIPADTFLWGVFDPTTGETKKRKLDDLTDSHIQNICLHLRARYGATISEADLSVEEESYQSYRALRHRKDIEILETYLLPELEKRGLAEVTEEVEWSSTDATSEIVT